MFCIGVAFMAVFLARHFKPCCYSNSLFEGRSVLSVINVKQHWSPDKPPTRQCTQKRHLACLWTDICIIMENTCDYARISAVARLKPLSKCLQVSLRDVMQKQRQSPTTFGLMGFWHPTSPHLHRKLQMMVYFDKWGCFHIKTSQASAWSSSSHRLRIDATAGKLGKLDRNYL